MSASRTDPYPPDLAGQRAVVTGAARGIGLAIARRLNTAGSVVIAVDKDKERLLNAVAGSGCNPVVGDLSSDDTPLLADRLIREHGPISLIVNNVGITTPHTFSSLDERDFDLVLRTNLRGPWFFTRRLVADIVARKLAGAILYISSVHDTFPRLHPHYSASKAAIAMLVKELAHELAPHGIRVNAIAPGWIRTEEYVDPERERRMSALIPVGRAGTPEDVARIAVMLLSNVWAGYITGADIAVDGGLSSHSWMMDL